MRANFGETGLRAKFVQVSQYHCTTFLLVEQFHQNLPALSHTTKCKRLPGPVTDPLDSPKEYVFRIRDMVKSYISALCLPIDNQSLTLAASDWLWPHLWVGAMWGLGGSLVRVLGL